MEVDALIDEMYAVAPERFIEERNARVRELRAKGERKQAAAIGKLTKPSPAAWLANLLVRTRPQLVDELLDLGDGLRLAQRRGAGDDMRTLSARRQNLIRQLGRAAGEEAGGTGHKLSASHQRQLEETLEAAVADTSIASELRRGRLTRAVAHVGFGDELVDRRPVQSRLRSRPRTGRDAPAKAEADHRDEQNRRAAARADTALVKARADLIDAERAVDQARKRHDTATTTRRQVAKALKEAERELRRARSILDDWNRGEDVPAPPSGRPSSSGDARPDGFSRSAGS